MASPFSSPYLSVCIRCPKDVADMLSEALICFGANSTSVDEQGSGDSRERSIPYFLSNKMWACAFHMLLIPLA